MPGVGTLLVYASWLLLTGVALGLVYLALVYRLHPHFLIPAAVGLFFANVPHPGLAAALAPLLKPVQAGLDQGLYPSLILLCRGAGFDLSFVIAHPRQLFLGLLTPVAFFGLLLLGWYLGLSLPQAGGGGLIGSGDGLPAIFFCGHLTRDLVGPVGLAAFALAGLVPHFQPALVRVLTTRQERMIRMPATRKVAKRENILFAGAGLVLTALLVPGAVPLTGMFFLGNLLRESGVVERLARTLTNRVAEVLLMLLGLAVGSSCQAAVLFSFTFGKMLLLGLAALLLVTFVGVASIKVANLFFSQKINPLVGGAAVALIPDAAQAAQIIGRQEDPHNNLYSHALATSQAAFLAATLTAGLFWSTLAP